MQLQSTAGQPAGHTSTDLVLERLPNGEHAWLRPEPTEEPVRYVVTDAGRRALAVEALFGPWPTCAGALSTVEHPCLHCGRRAAEWNEALCLDCASLTDSEMRDYIRTGRHPRLCRQQPEASA